MGDRAKGAGVGSSTLTLLELFTAHEGDELLSLDLGELDGAGELMLDEELLLHEVWEGVEEGLGPGCKTDIGVLLEKLLLQLSNGVLIILLIGEVLLLVAADLLGSIFEDLVEFLKKLVEVGQVAQKTLRDQYATVVLLLVSSVFDGVADSVDDVLEGLLLAVGFLTDDDHVGAGLESTLDSEVGWLLTHQSDEVPVLDGGGTVSQHVADQLRVDFRGGVEADRGADVLVVDVAVHSAWNHDHAGVDLVLEEVLSQVGAIGHGQGGANEHETIKAKLGAHLGSALLLLGSTELIEATADVVNTTQVVEVLEVFAGHHLEVLLEKTINTLHETKQLNLALLLSLESEQTIDNVVDAWCLAAHIDETDLHSLILCSLQKFSVKLRELIIVLVGLISHKAILHLNEVVTLAVFLEAWQLLTNQLFGVFVLREVSLDGGDGDLTLLKLLWDGGNVLDSGLRQFGKKVKVAHKSVA